MGLMNIFTKPCEVCGTNIERRYKSRIDIVKTCSPSCGTKLAHGNKTDLQRLNEKVKIKTGSECHEFTAARDNKGYGRFFFDGSMMLAHRASWAIHNGPIGDGLNVLHKCDNPSCVNPEHMFLGTPADNMKDRDNKGRQAIGEDKGTAKLTNEEVIEIKHCLGRGDVSQADLGKMYSVTQGNIAAIKSGKTWSHLEAA